MSKNISKLSGRIGLKNNLFQKISERSLKSKNGEGMKEIAEEYNLGVSTIHGAESFYEFLRPEHRAKKAFICNGSACMCAGTQENLKDKLETKVAFLFFIFLIFLRMNFIALKKLPCFLASLAE